MCSTRIISAEEMDIQFDFGAQVSPPITPRFDVEENLIGRFIKPIRSILMKGSLQKFTYQPNISYFRSSSYSSRKPLKDNRSLLKSCRKSDDEENKVYFKETVKKIVEGKEKVFTRERLKKYRPRSLRKSPIAEQLFLLSIKEKKSKKGKV